MSIVVTIAGSPAGNSSSDALLSHIVRRISQAGHHIVPLVLRDLPAAALLAGQVKDWQIAAAVAAVQASDAIVIGWPATEAGYSGLLTSFLDLLSSPVCEGQIILPLMTGESLAQALAVDDAVRPVLNGLGAAHIEEKQFVPSSHVRAFPDGGVLIDPASAGPVTAATERFLRLLSRQVAASTPRPAAGRVSPVAGESDLALLHVQVGDPELAPLLDDLVVEYGTRYSLPSPYTQLTEVPATDFQPPDGGFIVLRENGETVAGGAIRRYDARSAEVKRVWTSSAHRRRGMARRLMAELELLALQLGYRRVHLTTGPRQPEATALYLAAGYQPEFDLTADPETIGPLAFVKELPWVGGAFDSVAG